MDGATRPRPPAGRLGSGATGEAAPELTKLLASAVLEAAPSGKVLRATASVAQERSGGAGLEEARAQQSPGPVPALRPAGSMALEEGVAVPQALLGPHWEGPRASPRAVRTPA